jgi:hypothetical protein
MRDHVTCIWSKIRTLSPAKYGGSRAHTQRGERIIRANFDSSARSMWQTKRKKTI